MGPEGEVERQPEEKGFKKGFDGSRKEDRADSGTLKQQSKKKKKIGNTRRRTKTGCLSKSFVHCQCRKRARLEVGPVPGHCSVIFNLS